MTGNVRLLQSVLFTFAMVMAGCGSQPKQDKQFFTSGNHEADQRADQRVAKDQQLKGQGSQGQAALAGSGSAANPKSRSLYDRLGGDAGIKAIVADFIPRAIDDPRVNWNRKGVVYGGFSIHHNRSMAWDASADHINTLKDHMAQFLALATGGPSSYQGKPMSSAHYRMHISNPEFDAAVGDLKATLDKVGIAVNEQRELLAVVESTRAEIVEER